MTINVNYYTSFSAEHCWRSDASANKANIGLDPGEGISFEFEIKYDTRKTIWKYLLQKSSHFDTEAYVNSQTWTVQSLKIGNG